MATPVTRYLDSTGKEHSSEAEANFADMKAQLQAEVDAFVAEKFPSKEGAKRGNAHASTAAKAIMLWAAHKA